MNQMQGTPTGSVVMEYGGYGGFEVNDISGNAIVPVRVPQMNSPLTSRVQPNNAAYYPQAQRSYYPNNSYSDPRTGEILELKKQAGFWKSEALFWQFERDCSMKEKDIWKTEADLYKSEVEKWKEEANNWQAESLKLKAEATNWQAESEKWKAQSEKFQIEYYKNLTQKQAIERLWKQCENAKEAESLNFQSSYQKLILEGGEKDKMIEKQKKELLDEKQRYGKVQAELKAKNEALQQIKKHEQMTVTTMRKKALAKENELQAKLQNQTMELEIFTVEMNRTVKTLEDKVRSLESDVEDKESALRGFGNHCGQLYEAQKKTEVELRQLKDFMMVLTCDLQDNVGKFMKRYGLSVTPVLESKWDWRSNEEKCLVSHLRMMMALTKHTYQECEEQALLKRKQACETDKTTEKNAVGNGQGKMVMGEKRPEKRGLSERSSNFPAAGKLGSSKRCKF